MCNITAASPEENRFQTANHWLVPTGKIFGSFWTSFLMSSHTEIYLFVNIPECLHLPNSIEVFEQWQASMLCAKLKLIQFRTSHLVINSQGSATAWTKDFSKVESPLKTGNQFCVLVVHDVVVSSQRFARLV